MPTFLPWSTNFLVNTEIKVDLPDPGAPVTPKM